MEQPGEHGHVHECGSGHKCATGAGLAIGCLYSRCQIETEISVGKAVEFKLTGSLLLWLFAASFQAFKKYFSNTSVCLVALTLPLLQRVWAVPKLPLPHV